MCKYFKAHLLVLTICISLFTCASTIMAEESAQSHTDIIKIDCPTSYPFLLVRDSDSLRLASKIFYIANYSTEDILLDLSNIHLVSDEKTTLHELSNPVDHNYVSDTKDVFAFLKVMVVDPNKVPDLDSYSELEIQDAPASPQANDYIITGNNRPENQTLLLKAANYDTTGKFKSLNPESVFSFYIAGSATPNKELHWNKGDINFKFDLKYTVVPTVKSSEAVTGAAIVSSPDSITINEENDSLNSENNKDDLEAEENNIKLASDAAITEKNTTKAKKDLSEEINNSENDGKTRKQNGNENSKNE